MDYATLNALPAEAFLDPSRFVTDFDARNQARDGYGDKQYAEGLKVSREAREVFISANGTWGADLKPTLPGSLGASLTSYEGIGYHANTADLLRGFLAGPAPIKVYRRNGETKTIKPRTGE